MDGRDFRNFMEAFLHLGLEPRGHAGGLGGGDGWRYFTINWIQLAVTLDDESAGRLEARARRFWAVVLEARQETGEGGAW